MRVDTIKSTLPTNQWITSVLVVMGTLVVGSFRASATTPLLRETKITVPNASALGWRLDSTDNRVIVGTSWNWGCPDTGSAYVLERQKDGSWSEPIRLLPEEPASHFFGRRVAISGNTAVVGAEQDDDTFGTAYVFKRDPDLGWQQEAKLQASDRVAKDRFGLTVAISGDTIMVGASRPSGSVYEGSTYIFERDGSNWVERAKLNRGPGINHLVQEMLNDTAVIDSYNYEDRSSTFFVMHRTDLGWVEQDTLSVPGETSSSFMGFDLSAKTLIAGASFCSEIVLNGGAAHIFSENENGLWVHEAKLTPSDIYEYQYFGRRSVALSGNTALVGGYPVGGDGYAYLFRRDEQCDWTEQFKLVADDTGKWDYFGRSVAICGDALVIGASGDDDAGENAGAVYIYDPVPEPSTTFLLIGLGMVALGTCWKSGK